MKSYDQDFKFVSSTWELFPTKLIYRTNSNKNLIIDNSNSIYIYSIHSVKKPDIEKLDITTQFFQVYKCIDLEFTNPVGYLFIPTLPTDYIIRYTPFVLTATGPNVTEETYQSSSKEIIYKDKHISILHMSCGCEAITDLSAKLGVFIGE